MKNSKVYLILLFAFAMSISNVVAQVWELNGNLVNPGEFLGSTNNEFLNFRQNNVQRTRYQNVVWQGYNNAPAVNNANRIHYGLNGNNQVPFSMMHLGQNINQSLYRRWMNVGTTYGAGADVMYAGLLQIGTKFFSEKKEHFKMINIELTASKSTASISITPHTPHISPTASPLPPLLSHRVP